jgi:hypothetical protein
VRKPCNRRKNRLQTAGLPEIKALLFAPLVVPEQYLEASAKDKAGFFA